MYVYVLPQVRITIVRDGDGDGVRSPESLSVSMLTNHWLLHLVLTKQFEYFISI